VARDDGGREERALQFEQSSVARDAEAGGRTGIATVASDVSVTEGDNPLYALA